MSHTDVKPVSSTTGTFKALQQPVERSPSGKAEPAAGKDVPSLTREKPDLEALAAKLNSASRSIGRDLRFKVDMASGNSVIQVLDRETGEIIREIPPEKAEYSLSVSGDFNLRLYDGRA